MLKTRTARVTNFKALDDEEGGEPEGTFEAVVSVFGNVDYAGDRVIKGAFAKSLATWSASGDPIPVVWSHQWQDPEMHIGGVLEAEERDEGLWVKAQLDVAENPSAANVWRLLSKRRVREFSFAYDVLDEKPSKEANDLLELDVIEVGPTLKGMNPETLLLEAKARRDARAGRAGSGAKDAVDSHSTDTSDGEWDGPANEARLDNDAGEDVFRAAFAWQDPDGDADTKAAWKFIHHEIAEDGTVGAANLQACRTGIGVLNGGRGGTSIPDSDRQGVYDHLAKHLRDADEEPPALDEPEDAEGSDEGESTSSGASSRPGGRKARVNLDGSYEQLQGRLSAAVTDWALAAFRDVFIAGLEATYPDRVVAYVETWDQPWGGGDYHQASYEIDDDGVVSLGEPEAVELIGVVAPKSLPAAAAAKKDTASAPIAAATASAQSVLATLDVAELDT